MIGRKLSVAAAAGAFLAVLSHGDVALAQKSGGVLKIQHLDSPASMSIHEEATYSVVVPIMGVMNNLVVYKQDVPQNSLQSIVPDLAESWSWARTATSSPSSCARVKCTTASPSPPRTCNAPETCCRRRRAEIARQPREAWYRNLDRVTADNDYQATFRLGGRSRLSSRCSSGFHRSARAM
jgi:peptide/nickel transport system substrate-binding protein